MVHCSCTLCFCKHRAHYLFTNILKISLFGTCHKLLYVGCLFSYLAHFISGKIFKGRQSRSTGHTPGCSGWGCRITQVTCQRMWGWSICLFLSSGGYSSTCCCKGLYSRTSMAQTLMAHSPGLARTIIIVPTGNFMQNPTTWMAGTTLG